MAFGGGEMTNETLILLALLVPTAGAVDPSRLAVANRLVGNPASSAAFETAGGLVVRLLRATVVADSSVGARRAVPRGAVVRIEAGRRQPWSYLAIRGGLRLAPVLGSVSQDTLSGLGPPPIVAGARFAAGPDPRTALATELVPPASPADEVPVWPGPQVDRFADGLAALTLRSWTVAGPINRIGARLEPQPFDRVDTTSATMPSAGLVRGAVQVTPAGEPIVMLSNHPTTGGYPVIAVVDPSGLPDVAQTAPGSTLRFRPLRR